MEAVVVVLVALAGAAMFWPRGDRGRKTPGGKSKIRIFIPWAILAGLALSGDASSQGLLKSNFIFTGILGVPTFLGLLLVRAFGIAPQSRLRPGGDYRPERRNPLNFRSG